MAEIQIAVCGQEGPRPRGTGAPALPVSFGCRAQQVSCSQFGAHVALDGGEGCGGDRAEGVGGASANLMIRSAGPMTKCEVRCGVRWWRGRLPRCCR